MQMEETAYAWSIRQSRTRPHDKQFHLITLSITSSIEPTLFLLRSQQPTTPFSSVRYIQLFSLEQDWCDKSRWFSRDKSMEPFYVIGNSDGQRQWSCSSFPAQNDAVFCNNEVVLDARGWRTVIRLTACLYWNTFCVISINGRFLLSMALSNGDPYTSKCWNTSGSFTSLNTAAQNAVPYRRYARVYIQYAYLGPLDTDLYHWIHACTSEGIVANMM